MREVKFRWIDKYLIHLKLQEKLFLLFGLPMLVMVLLASIGISRDFKALEDEQLHLAQAQVQTLAQALAVLPEAEAIKAVKAAGDDLALYQANGRPFPGFAGSLSNKLERLAQSAQVEHGQIMAATSVPGRDWYLSLHSPLEEAEFWATSQDYLVLLGAALVLLSIITYYVSTFIGGALYTQVQALTKVAEGDLTFRLNFFPVRDEFSTLAIAIDKLAERQHQLVKLIKESSDALGGSADLFGSEAANTQRLAQDQRQSLDSLATAMEEMSATVKEVARHAEDASGETQHASNESQKGARNIQQTIGAIEALSREIFEASAAVTKVNDNARRIDEVVTTINGISEQTNLLALNAAIEAARAGEQGRGFAVVADEVRTLAARTQQATVEIQKMIEALQAGTGEVARIMDKTVQQAEHGGTLIAQAGEDLTTITRHSEQVFSMMAQIAASAEEQSAVAEEIAQNITAVRQQSLSVEQAAQDNAKGTQELQGLARSLADILKGLKI
ncbi:methyl-accepting chemotaxis protein [Gallaecimonas xiamenensis]|uniref:Methyl-accepting chemotaxis sensory transducer n=1 Tax=Gallaecimonas xiamenensis 3-C-1 TaxID=745411 RepID=K2IZU2_9GAMM|nr:methyl-accepting chemotaxis protein [Gallaecimonas xiamenensis]EKE68418.1 methyl-accepting chemotaxis sensory transducer [Gallaecimonas xiamenensis 3-C-1]